MHVDGDVDLDMDVKVNVDWETSQRPVHWLAIQRSDQPGARKQVRTCVCEVGGQVSGTQK